MDNYGVLLVIVGLIAGYVGYQYHQYNLELTKPKIEDFVRISDPGNLKPSPPSFVDWLLE